MPTTLWLWETESSEARSSLVPMPTSESHVESYASEDGPGGLALCEAEQAARNWRTAGGLETLFTGGSFGVDGGSSVQGRHLDSRRELLEWYWQEPLPILPECSVWNDCRFVEEEVAAGCQFYALHQPSHREALESNERARARSTPWLFELKRLDWFDEPFTRVLYRRIDPSTDDVTQGAAEKQR